MAEPTFREMTSPERARLEEELARARANPVSVSQALSAAAGVLGAWLYRPMVVLAGMNLLAWALLPADASLWLHRLTLASLLVLAGVVAVLVIVANRAWMGFLARLHRNVTDDLAENRVEVRPLTAVAAVTLKLDQDAPLGHVLELEGQRLMFIPGLLSAGEAGFPSDRFEVAFAPASAVFLSVRACGAPLDAPERAFSARAVAPVIAQVAVAVPGTLAALAPAQPATVP